MIQACHKSNQIDPKRSMEQLPPHPHQPPTTTNHIFPLGLSGATQALPHLTPQDKLHTLDPSNAFGGLLPKGVIQIPPAPQTFEMTPPRSTPNPLLQQMTRQCSSTTEESLFASKNAFMQKTIESQLDFGFNHQNPFSALQPTVSSHQESNSHKNRKQASYEVS